MSGDELALGTVALERGRLCLDRSRSLHKRGTYINIAGIDIVRVIFGQWVQHYAVVIIWNRRCGGISDMERCTQEKGE